MTAVVYTGCSFTSGVGLDKINDVNDAKDSPNLWVNHVHYANKDLKHLDLLNVSKGGASNADIFQQTVNAIADHGRDIKYVFCQWTSMPRLQFKTGLELWETRTGFSRLIREDINLSTGEKYTQRYLNDLFDRLRAMIHLHPEIVKVVEYCNCIKNLSKHFDIEVFFINGLCPWDRDYFKRLQNCLPEAYTEFTKKTIIDIDSHNDEDIQILYNRLHDDYDSAGGICAEHWINLNQSMRTKQIDFAYDNHHPGIQSHKDFAQDVLGFLSNKKIFEDQTKTLLQTKQ